ncbi:MAG: hypothetical protein KAW17_05485 [Candidatus Eisenbacteria sp.]|nr:hypothetical protein [Candidatus Eisenbacteria bacterium]
MSRIILLAPLCLLLMVGLAFGYNATPPGGWGTDCTNWITYSIPWVSNPLCYDPVLGAGGEGWRDCVTNVQVEWPALDIELWIEMECTLWWDESFVDIHRYADYSDVVLYFHGGSCCNNGQWIITTPPTALGNLDFLPFQEDMFGRTDPAYGTDIPLTWDVNINGTGYVPMVNGSGGAKQFEVPLSCQYYVIRVIGDIAFHQEDGYYYLGGEGCYICPSNPM